MSGAGYIEPIGSGYKPFNFEQVNYYIGGDHSRVHDYEELVVTVSLDRAYALEGEVEPLANLVRARNAKLTALGNAMADVAAASASLSDKDLKDTTYLSNAGTHRNTLNVYGLNDKAYITDDGKISKEMTQKLQAKLKYAIDVEDNNLQQDVVSLQSYMTKRDDAFSTASQLMRKISQTREKTLANFG